MGTTSGLPWDVHSSPWGSSKGMGLPLPLPTTTSRARASLCPHSRPSPALLQGDRPPFGPTRGSPRATTAPLCPPRCPSEGMRPRGAGNGEGTGQGGPGGVAEPGGGAERRPRRRGAAGAVPGGRYLRRCRGTGGPAVPMALLPAARALCAAAPPRLAAPRRARSAPAAAPRGAAPPPPTAGRGARPVPPPPAAPPRGAERRSPPAVDFGDAREAFRSKSSAELLRGLLVLGLCTVGPLVEHNRQLLQVCQRVLGQALFERLMKMTFYGQFVAGEDQEAIKPLIRRNQAFGVGAVLDYSVEEDLSAEEAERKELDSCTSAAEKEMGGAERREKQYQAHRGFGDRRGGVISARTYFYADEAKCDQHMETFLRCIDASSGSSEDGFSAIKLTALGRPQFLLQFSEVLVKWRRFFHQMAAEQGQAGRAALEMKLEVEKLQEDPLALMLFLVAGGPGQPRHRNQGGEPALVHGREPGCERHCGPAGLEQPD
ncbi:proline dehydrogenase 1, mitochondrial isoform 2-T2 [Alca torda]